MRTRFTQLFGLDHPLLSAPTANHSSGTLAAAVFAEVVRMISSDAEELLRRRPPDLLSTT